MKFLSLFKKSPRNFNSNGAIKMSVEIKPSATRAVDAYRKLQAAHAEAAKMIIDLDAKIAERDAKIAEAKAILDEVFPEDVGGSTGGIVG